MSTRKTSNTKTRASLLNREEAANAVAKVDGTQFQTMLETLAATQGMLQSTFTQVGNHMLAQKQESDQMTIAIQEKTRQLQELTQKEASAIRLEELQLEIDAMKKQQAEEAVEYQRVLGIRQEQETQEFNRRRELQNQQIADERATADRAAQVAREDLERGWSIRENELKARETEITAMREEIAAFPGKLSSQIATAVSAAETRLTTAHKYELGQVQAESKSQIDMANLRAANAEKLAEEYRQSITALRSELDAERTRMEGVVREALSSRAANEKAAAIADTAAASANRSR